MYKVDNIDREGLPFICEAFMNKYCFISIFILLLQTASVCGQSIYQTIYYRQPPSNAIININDIKVIKDTSEKRIKSLKDPQRLIVLQNLGFAKQYLSQNNVLAVYDCLDKVDAILSDLPEALYLRALTHWKINDISYARYYFLKTLEVGTDDYNMFDDAARFFNEIGLYTESVRVYLHAYKKSKDSSWIFRAAQLALEFDEKSANYYFVVLAKSSYDAFGIEGISDIAAKNGLYEAALHGYAVAIKEFGKSKYQKINLSENNIVRVNEKIGITKLDIVIADWQQKFDNGEFLAALDTLKTISHASAVQKRIFLLNAKTYVAMGRYMEAETLLAYSMSQDTTLEEAFITSAQIEINQGNFNRAIDIIENGLKYNYDKTILYDFFLDLLQKADSKYYYNTILLKLSEVSEPDYEQSLMLAKYYLDKNEYTKSIEVLESIEQTQDVLLFRDAIDDAILLKKSENDGELGRYKEVIADLSKKEFSGESEELRVRLLSNAFHQLGDLYTAIDILVNKLNHETLSLNNTYYLQYLIGLSSSSDDMNVITDELIKRLNDWEKSILSNSLYIENKVNEFLIFGQFDYAVEYLSEIRGTSSISDKVLDNIEAKVYSQMAGKFYDDRNISEAVRYNSLALSKNRNNIDALYIDKLLNIYSKWGEIENYLLEDNYKVTIAMANDFLSKIPARIDVRMLLIRSLGLDKNIDALSILKQVNNMELYDHLKDSILSDIYYGFGIYDYCAVLYRQSLNASDDLYTQLMYIQTLSRLGRVDEALELTLALMLERPNDSHIQYLLSKLYLDKGEVEQAFEYINGAIEIFDNIKYQFQLGLCYEANGEVQTAFDIYANILQENKYYSDVYVHLIEILLENKKTKEILDRAKLLSETLVTFNQNNAYYSYLLANSHYNMIFFDKNPIVSQQVRDYKTTLLFFQNAMNRSIYGSDSKLRILIKDKMLVLNDSILESEKISLNQIQ